MRLVLLLWRGGFTAAEASDRRFKEWWIEHYGQIIAEKSRLAASAHRVFDRLKPIANSPASNQPLQNVTDPLRRPNRRQVWACQAPRWTLG